MQLFNDYATNCPGIACPGIEEIEIWLADPTAAADVAPHLDQCERCQQLLEQITASNELRIDDPELRGGIFDELPGFQLLELIGQGGMGSVYRARHERLNREVAVKLISAGRVASPRIQRRLEHEGKLLAKLNHPNIVRIFDSGQHKGIPYLVLELVNGLDLRRYRERLTDMKQIARLIQVVARALESVHQLGIVHRDLKPGNILLQPVDAHDSGDSQHSWSHSRYESEVSVAIDRSNYTPKIVDFGLSKQLATHGDESLSAVCLGTPSYMAPEQALEQQESVGPATDIHALGVIMYELMCGVRPFDGQTLYETLDRIRNQNAIDPRLFNTAIPATLAGICMKCLQKSPEKRYTSANELADELGRFISNSPLRFTQVYRLPTLRSMLVTAAASLAALAVWQVPQWGQTDQPANQIPAAVILQQPGVQSTSTAERPLQYQLAAAIVSQGGWIRITSQQHQIFNVADLPDELDIREIALPRSLANPSVLEWLAHCKSLEILNACHSRDIGEYLPYLNDLRLLQQLSISYCGLTDTQFSRFTNFHALSHLAILGNPLTIASTKSIATHHLDALEIEGDLFERLHSAGNLQAFTTLNELWINQPTVQSLAVIPHLKQLRLLTLDRIEAQAQLVGAALGTARYIEHLRLVHCNLQQHNFDSLCLSGNLEKLELVACKLTSERVAQLQAQFPEIEFVHSDQRDILLRILDCGGQVQWLNQNYIRGLPSAYFHDVQITAVELLFSNELERHDFEQMAALRMCRTLTLRGCRLSEIGLSFLPSLQALEELFLCHTKTDDSQLHHVRAAQNLTVLGLNGTDVTPAGIPALAGHTNLRTIHIAAPNLASDEALVTLDELPRLRTLYIYLVTDDFLQRLVGLRNLRELGLYDSFDITAQGVKALSRLQQLHVIDVAGICITDDDLLPLTALERLRTLYVTLDVDEQTYQTFRTLAPHCMVEKRPWKSAKKQAVAVPQ